MLGFLVVVVFCFVSSDFPLSIPFYEMAKIHFLGLFYIFYQYMVNENFKRYINKGEKRPRMENDNHLGFKEEDLIGIK